MLKRLASFVVVLALFLPTVGAEASPPQNYQSNFPAVALGIAAGVATWQVGYPTAMPTGAGTYHVVVDVSTNAAPLAGVALALATAGFAFSSPGCTVGVFVQDAVALNSVSGYVPITVAAGTKYCYGTGRFTLTLLPPINVLISAYRVSWEFEVETQQNANYDFLCDAPGTTLTAFNEGTTVCNDPVLSLSGTLNAIMSGAVAITGTLTVSDDAGGWAIHQDPLSGGLLIQVCGQNPDADCSPIEVNSNSTVSIGNATQNVSLETEPGFWELFGPTIFALIFIACLAGVAIWLVPGAVAFGMMVAIMAFQQPHAILILLQACAGFILTGAAMFWIVQRRDEFTTKRAKQEPRRFFD